MKSANMQVEVFKALIGQDSKVGYYDLGDRVAFTCDAFTAFAVPKKQLYMDISKMRQFPALEPLFALTDEDKELRVTKIEANFGNSWGTLMKLKGDGFNAWIRKSWFQKYYFVGYSIRCAGNNKPVKLVMRDEVCAAILPCHVNEYALEK